MASFNGFIRKSPSDRLEQFFQVEQFFQARGVETPPDFDWSSEKRGTALVKSINDLLSGLTDRQADKLKAELDHLASLADDNGMLAAEQVCSGQGIDLEGLETQ